LTDRNAEAGLSGDEKKGENQKAEPNPAGAEERSEKISKRVSLKKRWGLSFQYEDDALQQRPALLNVEFETGELPPSIPWHSALYFGDLDEAWRVLYRRNGQAVIVERPYQRGAILLCGDSFIFSNEALRSARHPELLTRLIGPHTRVVFDEAHLGIHKIPGVAGLVRRYGFQWFFLTIAMLFVLFVWKSAASFVPTPDSASADLSANAIYSRDYAQGLTNLLRRNIPPKSILPVVLEAWRKSFGYASRPGMQSVDAGTVERQVVEAFDQHQADPIKAYNTICKLLSKRN
jgi:hypothetical protein